MVEKFAPDSTRASLPTAEAFSGNKDRASCNLVGDDPHGVVCVLLRRWNPTALATTMTMRRRKRKREEREGEREREA